MLINSNPLKSKKLYKYINLLVRLSIGIAAVWFIYIKLKKNFVYNLLLIDIVNINYTLISLGFLLMFLNWGIEAFKWKYSIKKIQNISFKTAFKYTLTGITLSLLTPNRIGEIPARAMLLDRTKFKELSLKILVGSYSQMLITLFIGLIGFAITMDQYSLFINPLILLFSLTIIFILLLFVYFKVNKIGKYLKRFNFFKNKKIFTALSEFSIGELCIIIGLSLIRYAVFFFQFYLILKGMGIILISVNEIMLIAVCFMVASFIPTILISEIGVRGSVALLIFGTVSTLNVQIILASILLWLINVAVPALFGVYNLKDFKIFKEN